MVHPIWNDYPAIQQGLKDVKNIIIEDLRIVHPQVKEKIRSYLDAPGKYLRAGLTLLVGQALDGEIKEAKLYFAAGIEVLHLATLIHDDVIDEADSRRGLEAMHKTYSNRIAIYAGDYLLAYSNRLLARGGELMQGLADERQRPFDERLVERILAGELAQLLNQYKTSMTMKDYLKQIKGKTAFLFALACQVGAWKLPSNRQEMRHAFNAGQAIGMAFQLSDDLLDYQVSRDQMGKPQMQDVQNGIYTAPLLLALREDKELATLVAAHSGQKWPTSDLETLVNRIADSQAYEQTERLIAKYIGKADRFLQKLEPENRLAMAGFLQAVMKRKF